MMADHHSVEYGPVAEVYAVALWDAAEAQGQLETVFEEMAELAKLIDINAGFASFLETLRVSRERKIEALGRLFGERLSKLVYGFLVVLARHNRLNILREVQRELERLQDQRAGRVHVNVTAAAETSEEARSEIEQRLSEALGATAVVHLNMDESILGGLIIQLGDTLLDGSVRTRLNRLKEQLVMGGRHEIQSGRDRFCHPEGN